MIHHPLVAAIGAVFAGAVAAYLRARPAHAAGAHRGRPRRAARAGPRLRANRRAARRLRLRDRNRQSAGPSPTPACSPRAGAARRSASRCIPCRPMPRSHSSSSRSHCCCCMPRARQAGRCCRLRPDGHRRSRLLHRVLARSRRPRRNSPRRARRPADRRDRPRARRRVHSARAQRNTCGRGPTAHRPSEVAHD